MVKSTLVALIALFSLVLMAGVPASATQQSDKTTASDTQSPSVVRKKAPKSSAHKRKSSAGRTHVTSTVSKTSIDTREKLVKQVSVVRGKRKVSYQRVMAKPAIPAVPPVLSAGDVAGLNLIHDPLDLRSNAALVVDVNNSKVLFDKNSHVALPIASLTKLMTSLVVVEAHQDMDEMIEVTNEDIDHEKNTHSRLWIGARMTRANLLHIALMSSENRAASALGRNYPGGLPAFVAAMNAKAKALGMMDTHYVEPTGLSSQNVASARDLAKLVVAAHKHPMINQFSTDEAYLLELGDRSLQYRNSNQLVKNPDWDIGLQKTGYIVEAGRCLVMLTKVAGRPLVMIFLDSKGKMSRIADAGRVRKWVSDLRAQQVSDIEKMLNQG